jgi:hypothetical protein
VPPWYRRATTTHEDGTISKPEEFRTYRKALWTITVALAGLLGLLVFASIAVELYGGRGKAPKAPSPANLLQCSDDVLHLLEDLVAKPSELMVIAGKGAPGSELGRDWEAFSHEWDRRWETVNTRCEFDERADTGLGPSFDRMAWVHRNLPSLKLQYREMIKRFTDRQAETLAEMRTALERSRRLLQEQAETPPPAPTEPPLR